MFPKINLYGVLFIIGLATILGFGCHPVTATTALVPDTDYYNHTADLAVYTPTAAEKAEGDRIWIAENGEYQPNLTAAQESEIRLIINSMQAETKRERN
ncbi:hypothetical protein ACWA5Z_06545 [Testudinibacter sp. P80/BLE/0925]